MIELYDRAVCMRVCKQGISGSHTSSVNIRGNKYVACQVNLLSI